MIARLQCVLPPAHAIMAKSEAAAAARRVGRVLVTTASTKTTVNPNLKRGLTNSSSSVNTFPVQENGVKPIGARLSSRLDSSPR
jgi:hypothetical protein